MAPDHDSRPRLWLDVTTSRSAGMVHNGTTRIERSLIRELPVCLPDRLGFCSYSTATRRFSSVPAPSQPTVKTAAAAAREHRSGAVRAAGRHIERQTRTAIKSFARSASSLVSLGDRSRFPAARAGDVLLLAGENWSRYDFSVLRQLRQRHGLRIAAVLQDMVPHVHPQFFDQSGGFADRFRAYVAFLAASADVVFAISTSTRDDFLRAEPDASQQRVRPIELGADIVAETDRVRPAQFTTLSDRPFVLSVSTIQARKNFDLLYRLWQRYALMPPAEPPPHLVIVGRPGFGSADLLHMMRDDPRIAGSVTLIHAASDAELGWLYAHCLFTLYPSWYEGWGLPLTESLAYGKAFIASDRSSLPEAGQGLGIHLDPYDLMAWSREVLKLAHDHSARAAMERRILAERRIPNWADCARQISAILDQ